MLSLKPFKIGLIFGHITAGDGNDKYIYARVEEIFRKDESREVILKGNHLNNCFVLDEINWKTNGKDTYTIFPILKRISEYCIDKITPFEYTFG